MDIINQTNCFPKNEFKLRLSAFEAYKTVKLTHTKNTTGEIIVIEIL